MISLLISIVSEAYFSAKNKSYLKIGISKNVLSQ
jgi:hypothetical protein